MNEQKICTHFTNCIFCHSSIYGFRLRIFKVFLHNDCQNNMRDTGTDPGFEVRGSALKKIAPTGVRCENIWGISCEKSRFYAKKSLFSNFRPPPRSAPGTDICTGKWMITCHLFDLIKLFRNTSKAAHLHHF